jgi:3-hydroxybutyryl-CoA dehydrogenase
MKIERVAVLGGGLMGSGIAESVAVAGFDVVVRQVHDRAIESARKRLETSLQRATERGKLDAAAAQDTLGRIALTTELDDIAGVDLAHGPPEARRYLLSGRRRRCARPRPDRSA